MIRGLDRRVLDGVNVWSLVVLGGNPLDGSDALHSRMGSSQWDLSLGQRTGDGRFDEETFLGGLLIFFLGGRGRGRGTPGHDCRGVFAGQREFQTALFMLYIIYWSVEVSLHHIYYLCVFV
jgi:hypothetical protein